MTLPLGAIVAAAVEHPAGERWPEHHLRVGWVAEQTLIRGVHKPAIFHTAKGPSTS